MGILLILKGLNVNWQPSRTSSTSSRSGSSSQNPNLEFNGTNLQREYHFLADHFS